MTNKRYNGDGKSNQHGIIEEFHTDLANANVKLDKIIEILTENNNYLRKLNIAMAGRHH